MAKKTKIESVLPSVKEFPELKLSLFLIHVNFGYGYDI